MFYLVDENPVRWDAAFEKVRLAIGKSPHLALAGTALLLSSPLSVAAPSPAAPTNAAAAAGGVGDDAAGAAVGAATAAAHTDQVYVLDEMHRLQPLYYDEEVKLRRSFLTGGGDVARGQPLPWALVDDPNTCVERDECVALHLALQGLAKPGCVCLHSVLYIFPGNGVTTCLQQVALRLSKSPDALVIWVNASPSPNDPALAHSIIALVEAGALTTQSISRNVFVLSATGLRDVALTTLAQGIGHLQVQRQFSFVYLQPQRHPLTQPLPQVYTLSPVLRHTPNDQSTELSKFLALYGRLVRPNGGSVLTADGQRMVAALEHLKSVAETGKSIFVCMLRLVAAKFVCGDVDAMVKDEIQDLNPEQRVFLAHLALLELTTGVDLGHAPIFPSSLSFPPHLGWLLDKVQASLGSSQLHLYRLSSPVFAFPLLRSLRDLDIVFDLAQPSPLSLRVTTAEAKDNARSALLDAFKYLLSYNSSLQPWLAYIRHQNLSPTTKSPPVWTLLLDDTRFKSLLDDLLSDLRRESRRAPHNAVIFNSWVQCAILLADLFVKNKDFEFATSALDEVLKVQPTSITARHHLVLTLLKLPKLDVSLLNTTLDYVAQLLASAKTTEHREIARSLLTRATKLFPKSPDSALQTKVTQVALALDTLDTDLTTHAPCTGAFLDLLSADGHDTPDFELAESELITQPVVLLTPLSPWAGQPKPSDLTDGYAHARRC